MDFSAISQLLQGHMSPFAMTVTALFIVSEVLGSVPSIKASSIYGLVVEVLKTLKDQLTPQAAAPTPDAPAAPKV